MSDGGKLPSCGDLEILMGALGKGGQRPGEVLNANMGCDQLEV